MPRFNRGSLVRPQMSEVGIGGAIVAFGVIVLSVLIPFGVANPGHLPPKTISPSFWPKTIGWMIIVFGGCVILEGLFRPLNKEDSLAILSNAHKEPAKKLFRIFLAFVLLFATWEAVNWIGLSVASGAIIFVFGALFGERRVWLLAIIAIFLPLALYYAFTQLVGVPIPVGSLFG